METADSYVDHDEISRDDDPTLPLPFSIVEKDRNMADLQVWSSNVFLVDLHRLAITYLALQPLLPPMHQPYDFARNFNIWS